MSGGGKRTGWGRAAGAALVSLAAALPAVADDIVYEHIFSGLSGPNEVGGVQACEVRISTDDQRVRVEAPAQGVTTEAVVSFVQIGDRIVFILENPLANTIVYGDVLVGDYNRGVLDVALTTEGAQSAIRYLLFVVDLDVDSDNTVSAPDFAPERTKEEEHIEDASTKPGRSICVNADDDDADGVPDAVDGWGSNPTSPDFRNLLEDDFVRARFELGAPINLTKAKIKVSTNGTGDVRIWTKSGAAKRNIAGVNAGGDLVLSGTYTASELGFKDQQRTVDLWLEGLGESAAAGDLRLLVELDRDGDGPEALLTKDAARTTVLGVRVLDNSAGAIAEHVQVARWENAFTGTAGSRSVLPGFQALDPERYYVRVRDATATSTETLKGQLSSYARGANPNFASSLDTVADYELKHFPAENQIVPATPP
ncbi:MAG: hypothetical protein HY763_06405 [Planctomycetes bacterium]|nr:hypothetical protein [Planctomycetota bacterium]